MVRAYIAITLVTAMLLAACGGEKRAAPVVGANCADVYYQGEGAPDVLIVSDFPRRGPLRREVTTPMVEAIKLVLRRRDFRAGHRRVGYQSCDDSVGDDFDPAACAANAEAYVANKDVLGVIGTYNSGCATEILPIISRRSAGPLAMISPSNTYLGLTSTGTGVCCGHPRTLYADGIRNYVRVVAPDDRQGSAGAVAAKDRGAKRAVVLVQQTEDYAIALAASFTRASRNTGTQVVTIPYDTRPAFAKLAREVASHAPDVAYIAGLANANGRRLVEDLRAALGESVILIAGDAWAGLAAEIGPAGEGMLVTHAGSPVERLSPAGASFIAALGIPIAELQDKWVPESGQATEVLLEAIARSDGTRASVVEEIRATRVKGGLLGDFGFDAKGDIDPAFFALYRFHAGKEELAGTIVVPSELAR